MSGLARMRRCTLALGRSGCTRAALAACAAKERRTSQRHAGMQVAGGVHMRAVRRRGVAAAGGCARQLRGGCGGRSPERPLPPTRVLLQSQAERRARKHRVSASILLRLGVELLFVHRQRHFVALGNLPRLPLCGERGASTLERCACARAAAARHPLAARQPAAPTQRSATRLPARVPGARSGHASGSSACSLLWPLRLPGTRARRGVFRGAHPSSWG